MVFSSPAFLFLFLPFVLVCSCFGGLRVQNLVLIGCSLFFYYYGGGVMLLLLLASCVANWGFGVAIERWRARAVIVSGLAFNLGVLI